MIFLLISNLVVAQRLQSAIWSFGIQQKLHFTYQPVKVVPGIGVYNRGASSICDSIGRFLFSATDKYVVNRNDKRMKNGVFINPFQPLPPPGMPVSATNFSSCVLVVPFLRDVHLFHVFVVFNKQVTDVYGKDSTVLLRKTLDMRLDSGRGDLINPRSDYKLKEHPEVACQLSCAMHADGKRTWLIGRKRYSDTLIAWLVSDTMLGPPVYTKTHSPVDTPNIRPYGSKQYDSQIKMSPNSEMLFVPRRSMDFPYHELYRFNKETGAFSGPVYIQDSIPLGQNYYINGYPDGAFSPDSRKLYVCLGTRRTLSQLNLSDSAKINIWQYDVSQFDSLAIAQSKSFLGRLGKQKAIPSLAPFAMIPAMQLALDGKIYISPGLTDDTTLSVIQCPDKPGLDCGLQWRRVKLLNYAESIFPVLNQTFVRNAGIFQLQANKRKLCQGDTLELSGYGAGAEKFRWSVSPAFPQNTKVDTLTWQKIDTRTIPPGAYTFRCQASSRCGDVFDKEIQVEVLPLPQKPNLLIQQKPVLCRGDSAIIRVQNPVSGYRYFWSTGDSLSAIVVKRTGLFSLDSLVNAQGCGHKLGDTVAISIKNAVVPEVPVISGPGKVEICEGEKAQLSVDSVQLAVKYNWSNGIEGDSIQVGGGQYSVISVSAEGCQSGPSDSVSVVEIPNPKPVFMNVDSVLTRETLSNQNYCAQGQEGSRFSFSVTGGEKVDSSENCITVKWNKLTVGSGQLTVRETTANPKCDGLVSQNFIYQPNLQIPNLVTPNGDGKNDVFKIEDLEFYASYQLQIFDRWGKKVLESSDYKNDWEGDAGIYFYSLVVEGKEFKGWLMVE